jgi:methylphosphotriester-DNA--protein-cysteine methyltransferase
MKEITFQDKVYKKLIEMLPIKYSLMERFEAALKGVDLPERKPYDLLKKVSEDNRQHFIKTVKDFIRHDYGKAHGFYIEFSNDYNNIVKKEY